MVVMTGVRDCINNNYCNEDGLSREDEGDQLSYLVTFKTKNTPPIWYWYIKTIDYNKIEYHYVSQLTSN